MLAGAILRRQELAEGCWLAHHGREKGECCPGAVSLLAGLETDEISVYSH
jgi:hypothetical protein